jgi:3-hydroxyisobutyrate dehydrogenase-like beta-hydroxyacid dehydrogenase
VNVAVLGTGIMGGAMARRAAAELLERGAARGDAAADMAAVFGAAAERPARS